ncbi:MAG: hypothetical protein ABS81_04965 [Pseudonocardia sp. SCN 72-86]|nr:MAG: hypothetical protein ABS81_04965 [Pseudonocardia sp. SCN 72-86]
MELVPLCELDLTLAPLAVNLDGPRGHRVVAPVSDVVVKGERLSGRLDGSWVDCASQVGNTLSLDVRASIKTDDGATIYVTYLGRADASSGGDLGPMLYCAPQFETDDERYTWLNSIQAAGCGRITDGVLHYEWFELR